MAFDAPLPPYNASDPLATFFNVSCLDLLLIEMVPLAERMARRAERIEAGELDVDEAGDGVEGGKDSIGAKEREDGGGEVYRDALFFRLDALGYRVGQGLSERYVSNDQVLGIDSVVVDESHGGRALDLRAISLRDECLVSTNGAR